MENSDEIVRLLESIDNKLDYLMGSTPDLEKIEKLLEKILQELKKKPKK